MSAKRRPGEGSVSPRTDRPGFKGKLPYSDENGQRKLKYFYGKTENEVWAKIDVARKRKTEGAPLADSTMRLDAWIPIWLETSLEASSLAQNTKDWYRDHSLHLSSLGALELGKIRVSHVEGLIVQLRKEGKKPATVRGAHLTLRKALKAAVADKLIAYNATLEVPTPKPPDNEAFHLPMNEVDVVLDAAQSKRYVPVMELCAATGMRRGEACGLEWVNVDLVGDRFEVGKPAIKLRKSVGRTRRRNGVPGKLVLAPLKTVKSRRTIPLTPDLVALLKAQRARQAAERLAAGDRWVEADGAGLVFRSGFGTLPDPNSVWRGIRTAAAKTDVVGKVKVHTLRHSLATDLLKNGTNIKAVADILGHSSITVTGDIYGHTSDDTARDALEGLSRRRGNK